MAQRRPAPELISMVIVYLAITYFVGVFISLERNPLSWSYWGQGVAVVINVFLLWLFWEEDDRYDI